MRITLPKWFSPKFVPFLMASSLAVVTAALASRGIHWEMLHPDEECVAGRANSEINGTFVHQRVFPAGYYKLARIMNWADNTAAAASRGLSDWMEQYGAPNAGSPSADSEPGARTPRLDNLVLRIREWNVWFAACSTFLVFFLLRVLFNGGGLAPAMGTLIYAAHPYVVEHSHYAETDAGMIATGALAFLLMVLALRQRRPWVLMAAAAAAGFTITVKFSYLPLVAAIPIEAVILARRLGWRRHRAIALAVGALAAMLAGYVVGTPMLILAPERYFTLSRLERASAFSENAAVLARLAHVSFPNQIVKGRAMLNEAARLGWGWWLWVAAATPLWFSRKMRGDWAGLPLFGLIYAPLAFLAFPWFRQQEYLPMLPFLAATCALPLAMLETARARRAVFPAAIIHVASAICVASTLRDGVRVSSSFSQMETRLAARQWLALCAPPGRLYGFEPYSECGSFLAQRPSVEASARTVLINKVELFDVPAWEAQGLDYFMRTPSRPGRLVIDPRTGRRFPDFQRNFDVTMGRSVRLKTWRAAPDNRPKFSQYTLELYASLGPDDANQEALPSNAQESSPPFFIHGDPFCPTPLRVGDDASHIGPVEAIQLTRRPTPVFFDPLPDGCRYYAVAMNFAPDESATVRWTRGFAPRSADIPPRSATLFTSTKGIESPWRTVAKSSVQSNKTGQNHLILVAVTADPVLAESLLRRHGASGAADELAHRLAVDIPPVPAPSASMVPNRIRDDFSRLCTGPFTFVRGVRYPGSNARIAASGRLWAEFPVLLEPGRFSLRILLSNDARLTRAACDGDPLHAPVPTFDAIGARVLSVHPVGWAGDASFAYDLDLEADASDTPLLLGVAVDFGISSISASGAEIRWHPASPNITESLVPPAP